MEFTTNVGVNEVKVFLSQLSESKNITKKIKSMDQSERKILAQMIALVAAKNQESTIDIRSFQAIEKKT